VAAPAKPKGRVPKPARVPEAVTVPVEAVAPPAVIRSSVGVVPPRAPVSSPAPKTVDVTFVLAERQARRVSLGGGFNAWSPDATPMSQRGDGRWEITLGLHPGRHEYKFIVDGQWRPDPNAREQVPNGFDSVNSVVEVRG
jgi:hypothetical protein